MGKLSFKTDKFVFDAQSQNDHQSAKARAFQWDAQNHLWFTRSIEKARHLRAFADDAAEVKFKNYFITRFECPDNIPYPDDLDPKEFQIASAWHITTRSPAYCADQAGLGKTITATLCMNAVPGRVLIICPPYLKYNWQIEVNKWSTLPRSVQVYEKGKDVLNSVADVLIIPDSIIATPEVIAFLKLTLPFEWMFVDEAHRFKDENAKRTQALCEFYSTLSKRVCFLSGTPIPNRAMELFPIVNTFAPWAIDYLSQGGYGQTFCDPKVIKFKTRHGTERRVSFLGISHPKKLRALLREDFMVRHLKKDVLPELADKTRQFIFVDQPKSLIKYEKAALKLKSLDELIGEDFHLGDIATYRKESGLALIKHAVEIITDFLESCDEPLVVAAHHIDVVKGLFAALKKYNPLMIRGGMSAASKQLSVGFFQMDTRHRLLIGNIDAMGVGFTLTRARQGLTVEPSWVPGINEQMEDRIHRITQTDKVFWRYLVQRDSLNERMLWKVLDKQEGIDIVMS
jgi:SWI/SNF-related matrix-associated actin-dependent regulator 1 of chromatin subfamily A